MADRIIKSDSGNDVVIQNNGGTRKIEVTNSGDVEVTGDLKATTVKATNLKANDGTAALVVSDSTGQITSSGKIDLNGNELILDADADTSITADTDDRIDFRAGGNDSVKIGNEHLTISDGNLVIGTAGHGIDFSAQTATSASGASMAAELLDHYEEGTWTPGVSTGTAYASASGQYTRIGRMVFCTFIITGGGSDSSGFTTGLPFARPSGASFVSAGSVGFGGEGASGSTEANGYAVSLEDDNGGSSFSFRAGAAQRFVSAGKIWKGNLFYMI